MSDDCVGHLITTGLLKSTWDIHINVCWDIWFLNIFSYQCFFLWYNKIFRCFTWQSILTKVWLKFYFPLSPELVQPKDLTFSEVGPRNFRASWDIDAANVESFLVQFKPADDTDGHYVSLSVPGDTLTTVLPHLTPLTLYEVSIYAQYEKGESLPVKGYETTLEGTLRHSALFCNC